MASGFEFKSGGQSIVVELTDQKPSAHAGSTTFWAWLQGTRWRERLAAALPHEPPRSNNHLTPQEKALGFVHGLLCDARRLAHVGYFRRDPLLPELLGIRRVAIASALSRFFSGFASAGRNPGRFRPLWRFWLFVTPALIAHPAGKTTVKLAVPHNQRDGWSRLWEKILSLFPNCDAVENRPAFSY